MKKRWIFGTLGLIFVVVFSFLSKPQTPSTEQSSSQCKQLKILVTHKQGIGEREMAERIRRASPHLNIDCRVLTLTQITRFKEIAKRLTHYFVNSFEPDLVLSLEGGKHEFTQAKKYAAMTHGSDYYFSQYSKLPFERLCHYDGYLVSFPDRGTLKSYFALSSHKCQYMNWYSTCSQTEFKPPKNRHLFYCGNNMANTSYGLLYKVLFSMLDQTGYLKVYGDKNQWLHTPKSYKGFIKHDGESIINTIHNCGIALVLHAPDHFLGETPTARIFEAAAASSIIITDRHPFIETHFKSSVLYIDRSSSKEMFDQINAHMQWINTHPKEAIELARKSHEIFTMNFTLEKQLNSLLFLHETIKKADL